MKPTLNQTMSSKTVNLNALYMMAIGFANQYTQRKYGVDIPPEAVGLGAAILNIALRFITKRPLSEK